VSVKGTVVAGLLWVKNVFKTLRKNLNQSYLRSISYRAVNSLHVDYKNQSGNAA
jgi:hypothetical protein